MKPVEIKAGQVWEAKRVTRGWTRKRVVRVSYVYRHAVDGQPSRADLAPLSLFDRASQITIESLLKDYVRVRGKRARELLRRAA